MDGAAMPSGKTLAVEAIFHRDRHAVERTAGGAGRKAFPALLRRQEAAFVDNRDGVVRRLRRASSIECSLSYHHRIEPLLRISVGEINHGAVRGPHTTLLRT